MAKVEQKQLIISRETHGTRTHVRLIEPETGDVVSEFWEENRARPTTRRSKRKTTTDEFGKLFMENWIDVVMKKKLSIPERGVLSSLWAFIDWESNYLVHPETKRQLTGTQISKLLVMDKKQTLDYLDRLNQKGFISIVKRGGNGYENHYIMNTNMFFRGSQIKDIRQIEHFEDGPYTPKKRIAYIERESEDEMDEDNDLPTGV